MCFGYFLLLLQLIITTNAVDDKQLIFVTVMHRHGDRTPMNPYPNDPYSNISYWPEGWAQLTNKGKLRMYHIGEWLRNRYDNFLPKKYSLNDIYVLSSDKDRTIMSALCVLAALYDPIQEDVWNQNLLWQPIPVHTLPEKYDHMIAYNKNCPRYRYELNVLLEDKKVKEKLLEIRPLFDYIYKSINVSYTSDFQRIDKFITIFDNLFIQSQHGLELPEWSKSIYPDKMEKVSNYVFKVKYSSSKIKRLLTGPLITEIIERFYNKINNTLQPDRKMWIYSIHDSTILSFFNTIGYFDSDDIMPQYGSTLLLELYKINDTYYVTLFYKKDSNIAKPMRILGCEILCPLDKVRQLMQPFWISHEDVDKECQDVPVPFSFSVSAIILICFLSLLMLSSVVFCFCRNQIKDMFGCNKTRCAKEY